MKDARIDRQRLKALANRCPYYFIQGFDYFGSALWMFTITLFLLRGLELGTVQVGLIFAFGWLIQMWLEVPSGTVGDAISHGWAIFFAFLMQSLFSLSFAAIFVYKEWLGTDRVFWACIVAQSVISISLALQSGSIETWASKPIRQIGRRDLVPRETVSRWYADLEAGAKFWQTIGFLAGGGAAFVILAFLYSENSGWHQHWLWLWFFSATINLLLLVFVWWTVLRPEARTRTAWRVLFAAFWAESIRVIDISVDFVRNNRGERIGRRYLEYVAFNAGLFGIIFSLGAFGTPLIVDGFKILEPGLTMGYVYSLMAIVWGVICSLMVVGSLRHERHVSRLESTSASFGARGARDRYLWFAGVLAACFLAAYVALYLGRNQGAVLLPAMVLVVALGGAKYVEGVARPYISTLMSLEIPEDNTRATLLSFDSWGRSIVAAVLVLVLGIVAQKGLDLIWLALGVFCLLMASAAALAGGRWKLFVPFAALLALSVVFLVWPAYRERTVHGVEIEMFEAREGAVEHLHISLGRSDPEAGHSERANIRLETSSPYALVRSTTSAQGGGESLEDLHYEWTSHNDQGEYKLLSQLPVTIAVTLHPRDTPDAVTVELKGEAEGEEREKASRKPKRRVPREWFRASDLVLAGGIGVLLLTMLIAPILTLMFAQRRDLEVSYLIGSLSHQLEAIDWRSRAQLRHGSPLDLLREPGDDVASGGMQLFERLEIDGYGILLALDPAPEWPSAGCGCQCVLVDDCFSGLEAPPAPMIELHPRPEREAEELSFLTEEEIVGEGETIAKLHRLADRQRLACMPLQAGKAERGYLLLELRSIFGFKKNERLNLYKIRRLIQRMLLKSMAYFKISHSEESRLVSCLRGLSDALKERLWQESPIDADFWCDESDECHRSLGLLNEIRNELERSVEHLGYHPTHSISWAEYDRFLSLCAKCAIWSVIEDAQLPKPSDRALVEVRWQSPLRLFAGDSQATLQLWEAHFNLLRNGLRHGAVAPPWKPRLTISVEALDDAVAVTFWDAGPGFDKAAWRGKVEQAARIFGDEERRHGLWIALHAARELGGRLEPWVEETTGSLYPRLLLPLRNAQGRIGGPR